MRMRSPPTRVTLPRSVGLAGYGLSLDPVPASATVNAGSLGDLARQITQGGVDYLNLRSQLDQAKLARQLVKAQGQGAIDVARANALYGAQAVNPGNPSPALIFVAIAGLAAVFLLRPSSR